MYITGFLVIIQHSCIGMDCSRKLQSSQFLLRKLPVAGTGSERPYLTTSGGGGDVKHTGVENFAGNSCPPVSSHQV